MAPYGRYGRGGAYDPGQGLEVRLRAGGTSSGGRGPRGGATESAGITLGDGEWVSAVVERPAGPDLRALVAPHLPGVARRLVRLSADPNLVLRAQVGAEDLAVRIVPVGRMGEETARALLRYLLALGEDPVLRIPRPVRPAGGDWFAAIDLGGEAHRLSLLTWVPGEGARDPASFVEPARLRAMGAVVARMHRRAAALPAGTARAVRQIRVAAPFDPPVMHLGRALARRLATAREALRHALDRDAAPADRGVVHGDLWPQNWVFEDGRPGVIDFDELRCGPFALDLVNVVSNHALWDGYDGFVEELFAGYETVRPLPSGAREHVPLLTAALLLDWMRMVLTSQDEGFRAPLEAHLRPVAERIVELCGQG